MINNLEKNISWHQIIIEDDKALPGISIKSLLEHILRTVNFKYVILNDIEGAANDGLILSLQEKEGIIIDMYEILKVLPAIIQFDWGDFFLFESYPKNWDSSNLKLYPPMITQTNTTVRAVDDTYMYVYTPYTDVLNVLKENYEIESIRTDSLDNLDYPY